MRNQNLETETPPQLEDLNSKISAGWRWATSAQASGCIPTQWLQSSSHEAVRGNTFGSKKDNLDFSNLS